MSLNAYPKIHALGHRDTQNIFSGPVVIEEKYDGSQFSFTFDGEKPICRSKGVLINPTDPGMFSLAQTMVFSLAARGLLQKDWIYRCEFIAKPRHNVLTYSRTPAGYLVLFDVWNPTLGYLNHIGKVEMANILGLEPVRGFFEGTIWTSNASKNTFYEYMASESSLGGPKVEGIVIKNYHNASEDGPQVAKIVSAEFKEKHAHGPINQKGAQDEPIARIINHLRTEARWRKAIQHLRESGALKDGAEDIGPLLKEINQDILSDSTEEIKQVLFDSYWKKIAHGVTQGFPDFYKKVLAGNLEGPTVFEEYHRNSTPRILGNQQIESNE